MTEQATPHGFTTVFDGKKKKCPHKPATQNVLYATAYSEQGIPDLSALGPRS